MGVWGFVIGSDAAFVCAPEVGLGVLPEHRGRAHPEHYVPNLLAALSRAVRRDFFYSRVEILVQKPHISPSKSPKQARQISETPLPPKRQGPFGDVFFYKGHF